MHVGLHQDEIARKGWAVSAAEAVALHGRPEIAIIDLREKSERERHGTIPGSLHAPYTDLQENISDGGMLHELAEATGKRIPRGGSEPIGLDDGLFGRIARRRAQ